MALGDQLIFAGFAIAGFSFAAVLFLYIRLKHFVAKDKVHAVEDVSQLWQNGASPPKIALNEKGLRLRRYSKLSLVIFLIAAGMIGIAAILKMSSRPDALFAIVAAAFLLGVIFENRLKQQISRERVNAVNDVSRLWQFGVPPKKVLNVQGLRRYRYMRTAAIIFFIGIGIVFFGAIFGNDMPVEWGTDP